MPREQNFLLGQGERLTEPVSVPSGGGPKKTPYDFPTAQARIKDRLEVASKEFAELPQDACPQDEVVAVLTLHPRYLSKSDFPQDLLNAVDLRPVGSRTRKIIPDSWGIKEHPDSAFAEDIFVAGKKESFFEWTSQISEWTARLNGAVALTYVEDLSAFMAEDKLRGIPEDRENAMLEIVLHNDGNNRIIEAYYAYAQGLGSEPIVNKRRDVKGLTFLPVRAPTRAAADLAKFSFVRVARGMPTLRPLQPTMIRLAHSFPVVLPEDPPLNPEVRAVVFDGGLPSSVDLSAWVSHYEPPGIGNAVPGLQEHGLAVTSALLFGPLHNGEPAPQPICGVDHVRVLDELTGTDATDLEVVDVLDRITGYLDEHPNEHQFINISLGPDLAVNDDEITLWTAELDQRLAHGRAVTTVAAGNNGLSDSASGLNRVQPPGDAVNVISVGAATSLTSIWQRAPYSGVGPGRSPGIVKPDGVAFGGSLGEPFMVLSSSPGPVAVQTTGTSFAAPYTLRSATAVRSQLGESLNSLAIRGLLIHRAQSGTHERFEVGWGRFEDDNSALITCADDEALVIYQGELPVSQHLRVHVPMPDSQLRGMVYVSATLVISPEVDPEYPGAYTRSGLEVAFRPNDSKFKVNEDGSSPVHAQTKSFFSPLKMYGSSEYSLREDGHKWEPCLKHTQRFRASSLVNPVFDVYYHHRASGAKAPNPQPIPYAFIVSVKAPQVADLYNQVVRAYAGVLVPLTPVLRIPIQVTE